MACSKWFDVGQLIQNRLILFHKREDPAESISDEVYARVAKIFQGSSIRSQVIKKFYNIFPNLGLSLAVIIKFLQYIDAINLFHHGKSLESTSYYI